MQRQCLIIPIRPGSEPRLSAWIRQLDGRREEVRRAMDGEGMASESVFLLPEGEGHSLIVYTASPDLAAAAAAFGRSTETVDVEFKTLMGECLDVSRARLIEVLFAIP
ncbi:MAG: DUF6176 family protein [Gemmatimonadales bacterium]